MVVAQCNEILGNVDIDLRHECDGIFKKPGLGIPGLLTSSVGNILILIYLFLQELHCTLYKSMSSLLAIKLNLFMNCNYKV